MDRVVLHPDLWRSYQAELLTGESELDLKAFGRKLLTSLPGPARDVLIKTYKFYDLRAVLGPLTYNRDGLATKHNADFMTDPDFVKAYDAGFRTGSWDGDTQWRMHVILWAADMVKGLDGDFVECGVNKGGFSRAVMEYIDFNSLDKKFWLLDTFCGLDEELVTDEEKSLGISAGGFGECFDQVKKTFQDFKGANIIRGLVPGTLPQVKARKVCYLSIDMNCVAPEIAAIEYFWDKLVPGAVVILDDYGWKKHIAQKKAFDDFAGKMDVKILSLPTGQGFLLKP